jgi:hypothetical protein
MRLTSRVDHAIAWLAPKQNLKIYYDAKLSTFVKLEIFKN